MILCDECGLRPANIHLTTIVNGEKQDVNLCSECLARKKELKIDFSALAGTIGQMLQGGAAKQETPEEPIPELVCSRCGTSYEAFIKSGRVGCAQCYDAFRQPLGDWFSKRMGARQHIGRQSGGVNASIEKALRLNELRRRQKLAIHDEDYEAAATLRDQIRALQSETEETEHE